MERKSRVRAPNFTQSESLLMCDLVNKYKHVIENKRTDGASLHQKHEAWLKVESEFNVLTTGYMRTAESLQQNYRNLKKKAKKDVSGAKMEIPVDKTALVQNLEEYGTSSEGWGKVAEITGVTEDVCREVFKELKKKAEQTDKIIKKKIMGTGGGPPPKYDDDPLLEKVKGLVGPSIDGLYTIYDGDSCLMETQNIPPIEKNITSSQIIQPPNQVEYIETDEHVSEDQSIPLAESSKTQHSQDNQPSYFTNDRANLKRKPHDLLTRKRKLGYPVMPEKQTVSEKYKVLADAKMDLVLLQKELLQSELAESKEKIQHNNLLRAMELEEAKLKLEEAKLKFDHNIKLRQLELEKNLNLLNKNFDK